MAPDDSRSFSSGDSAVGHRTSAGWTRLHSWVFLAIVAVAMLLLVMQNRYHYFSPQGSGKAYRVDKFFGSVQEFDPTVGWMSARLSSTFPTPATTTMEPPAVVSSLPEPEKTDEPEPDTPMPPPIEKPTTDSETVEQPRARNQAEEPAPRPAVREEPASPEPARPQPEPEPPQQQELSTEERFQLFKQAFPDFGQEEFQLANEDLYPDWKTNVKTNGTWPEFVKIYQEFIQWWIDAGSPPESGFELWKRFMATKQ